MSQPFAIRLAENAVREFFTRWVAGLQPSLLLETNANGEILVSSRVSAPDYCHQTGQEDDQPPRQGHRHHRRGPQALLASAVMQDVSMHVQQLPMLLPLPMIQLL